MTVTSDPAMQALLPTAAASRESKQGLSNIVTTIIDRVTSCDF